jgi:2'-5' RNA ligase
VAIVPPPKDWGPIQAIREQHDGQCFRWPPHVNLLYPFYLPQYFYHAVPRLVTACAEITPFEVTLAEIRIFQHSSRKATLWLAPEPRENLVQLQATLQATCSDCDDLCRFGAGFTPHLSIGQAGSAKEARHFQNAWQRTWEPIRFECSAVALLQREHATPFKIEQQIPLATGSS